MEIMTGKELRENRRLLGYSQKQLAKQLNVNYMTVSRWERGLNNISPKYIQRLKILQYETKIAEANFRLILDKVSPLTARDFITSVLTATPEEIEKIARRGSLVKK